MQSFLAQVVRNDLYVLSLKYECFQMKPLFIIQIVCAIFVLTDSAAQNFPADINHIICYGQSLSLGSTDGIRINATGLGHPNTLMFNNGLRFRKGEDDNSMQRFVPLVEHEKEETPTSGMADMMMEQGFGKLNGMTPSYVFRNPGWGGKSIRVLQKNQKEPDYYTSLLRGVRRGKVLSDSLGKSFNVPCFTWTQGEEDIFRMMDRKTYSLLLDSLYQQINTDVRQITGQHNDVACIMYQTASHNRYYLITKEEPKERNLQIAIAQYEKAIGNNKFYMATPMYPFEYNVDNVHLTAVYARLLGAYYGLAAKKVLIDKEDWKPLHAQKISYKGRKIVLEMDVPVGPLVIDTNWVKAIDHYGFNIYRQQRTLRITKVNVNDNDQIIITCAEELQEGDRLTYAINGENTGRIIGSRGNIRDSQGDNITYTAGSIAFRLDNWLPIFEVFLPK